MPLIVSFDEGRHASLLPSQNEVLAFFSVRVDHVRTYQA